MLVAGIRSSGVEFLLSVRERDESFEVQDQLAVANKIEVGVILYCFVYCLCFLDCWSACICYFCSDAR